MGTSHITVGNRYGWRIIPFVILVYKLVLYSLSFSIIFDANSDVTCSSPLLYLQAKYHILTNVIVSQENTIVCNIKSQDSVHLSSTKNHAHKITRGIINHLNQNRQNLKVGSGICDGIKKHLAQDHQNHLLWLMNLCWLLTIQTSTPTLFPSDLITMVAFVSTILYTASSDMFLRIPIHSTRWIHERKLWDHPGVHKV